MNYDSGFRAFHCVFHDEVVLFSATQLTDVHKRVAMLWYIKPEHNCN